MTRKVRLLRIFWPALLFAAGVVAYASHEEAVAALGLNLDLGVVRLVTGGVCYFAAAWLGSRLVGFAIMAKSRRVPKLLQEILTAVFFFVALLADRKSTRLNSSHSFP